MERRFFVEKIGQQAILAGDEFSHAKNVLRLGVGDELTYVISYANPYEEPSTVTITDADTYDLYGYAEEKLED